jgi:hypothetical protein
MIASLVAAFHNFWPISGIALFATGCIWVRYSFVITPVNYSLAAVRFTNLLPAHIRPPITLFPRSICSSQRPPQASLLVLRSKHLLTAPRVPGSSHVSQLPCWSSGSHHARYSHSSSISREALSHEQPHGASVLS